MLKFENKFNVIFVSRQFYFKAPWKMQICIKIY